MRTMIMTVLLMASMTAIANDEPRLMWWWATHTNVAPVSVWTCNEETLAWTGDWASDLVKPTAEDLAGVPYGRACRLLAVGVLTNGAWYVDKVPLTVYAQNTFSMIQWQRYQTKLSDFANKGLPQKASIFRTTLRRNFGEGAETNRTITAQVVAGYFTAKQMMQTITAAELADAVMLDRMFAELSEWNGTGETWTLPWGIIP